MPGRDRPVAILAPPAATARPSSPSRDVPGILACGRDRDEQIATSHFDCCCPAPGMCRPDPPLGELIKAPTPGHPRAPSPTQASSQRWVAEAPFPEVGSPKNRVFPGDFWYPSYATKS